MATIGENRLKIYELLYSNPMCMYLKERQGRKSLNVLIIGTGWVGMEAFKAVLWAGQMPEVNLNITIASKNAELSYSKIKEVMPALEEMTTFDGKRGQRTIKEIYANIDIRTVSFDEINKEIDFSTEMTSEECLNIANQDYIIVSLGDDDMNYLIGEALSKYVKEGTCINVLMEEKKENYGQIRFFGNNGNCESELKRLAKNINFFYEQWEDERANKYKKDGEFEDNYEKEFKNPKISGDKPFDSLYDFIGKGYNVDSSFAMAVSIPYKLYVCNNDINKLIEVNDDHGSKLFKSLLKMEHRRWVAFMAIRGYRAPTPGESNTYLYKNKGELDYFSHKNDEKRLHACMCECDGKGIVLKRKWFDDKSFFTTEEYKKLSPLNKLSLEYHKKLVTILEGKNIVEKDISKLIETMPNEASIKVLLDNYIEAINRVIKDADNSVSIYKEQYNILIDELKEKEYKEVEQNVNIIHKKLYLYLRRNQRVDFFAIDEQLINMIPMCLWYGKTNNTILTITDGKAEQDVIVPTCLTANKAVFVLQGDKNDSYEQKVKRYFKGRGGNTRLEFEYLGACPNVDEVKESLEKYKKTNEGLMINCINNQNVAILLAIGGFNNLIPIVTYDYSRGIKTLNHLFNISGNLKNKSFSVDEFINLIDEIEYSKEEEKILFSEIEIISYLLFKYTGYYKGEFNPWSDIIKILQNKLKFTKEFEEKRLDYTMSVKHCIEYSRDDEKETLYKDFFNDLAKKGIIEKLEGGETLEDKYFSFIIKNEGIYKMLEKKGGNAFEWVVYYKAKYSGLFNDVRIGFKFAEQADSSALKNEIDIIGMCGVKPIFISCKTSKKINKDMVYELAYYKENYKAIGVLATIHNVDDLKDKRKNNSLNNAEKDMLSTIERAEAIGVVVIGRECFENNDNRFVSKIKQLVKNTCI